MLCHASSSVTKIHNFITVLLRFNAQVWCFSQGFNYIPYVDGQTELANREVKQILEKTVNPNHKDWSLHLSNALWTYRTTYKTALGMSPYRLVYGKVCHLPMELKHKAYSAIKALNLDLTTAGLHRKL